MTFECHITIACNQTDMDRLRTHVLRHAPWHFSAIDGDPELGQRVFCYATNHYQNQEEAIAGVLKFATMLKERWRFRVVRRKVEQIVFDERFTNKKGWVPCERLRLTQQGNPTVMKVKRYEP
jgi:hypothetical protein